MKTFTHVDLVLKQDDNEKLDVIELHNTTASSSVRIQIKPYKIPKYKNETKITVFLNHNILFSSYLKCQQE